MRLDEHPTVKWYRGIRQGGSTPAVQEELDTEWLKGLAIESGADDVGLVDIGRTEIDEYRRDILEIFPPTKSLISIVCHLQKENIRCPSRAVSDLEFLQSFERANAVARRVVAALEEKGVRALYPSAGFPMDMARWPGKMWSVSHKPIAVAAGLGAIGHHRLVIHPRFGSFIVLGTILLDRKVPVYDRPLEFKPCLECKLCVSVCPVGAIGPDGHFNFASCMTHNYRNRMGGFQDWVERVVSSRDVKSYRKKVSDAETVSMWQSLSYDGICNKSSYCMAVCPAGEENIGPFIEDRTRFTEEVVKPLQHRDETVYVVAGSDGEAHAARRFPHKLRKRVGNGLRPSKVEAFLESLPLVFQRNQSEGLDATYHFTFTGEEQCEGTVVIRGKTIEVQDGLVGTANMHVTADARTWIDFLAKERNLVWALLRRKIRMKGSPRLLKAFARCFPS